MATGRIIDGIQKCMPWSQLAVRPYLISIKRSTCLGQGEMIVASKCRSGSGSLVEKARLMNDREVKVTGFLCCLRVVAVIYLMIKQVGKAGRSLPFWCVSNPCFYA